MRWTEFDRSESFTLLEKEAHSSCRMFSGEQWKKGDPYKRGSIGKCSAFSAAFSDR